jgi:hypothetical protein
VNPPAPLGLDSPYLSTADLFQERRFGDFQILVAPLVVRVSSFSMRDMSLTPFEIRDTPIFLLFSLCTVLLFHSFLLVHGSISSPEQFINVPFGVRAQLAQHGSAHLRGLEYEAPFP